MFGRPYGADRTRLLYIGKAESGLRQRWREPKHVDWFQRTSRFLEGVLYFATCNSPQIDDIESAMIYVLQPPQNGQKLGKLPLSSILIYNVGNVPRGVLPIIDTDYPWFGIER